MAGFASGCCLPCTCGVSSTSSGACSAATAPLESRPSRVDIRARKPRKQRGLAWTLQAQRRFAAGSKRTRRSGGRPGLRTPPRLGSRAARAATSSTISTGTSSSAVSVRRSGSGSCITSACRPHRRPSSTTPPRGPELNGGGAGALRARIEQQQRQDGPAGAGSTAAASSCGCQRRRDPRPGATQARGTLAGRDDRHLRLALGRRGRADEHRPAEGKRRPDHHRRRPAPRRLAAGRGADGTAVAARPAARARVVQPRRQRPRAQRRGPERDRRQGRHLLVDRDLPPGRLREARHRAPARRRPPRPARPDRARDRHAGVRGDGPGQQLARRRFQGRLRLEDRRRAHGVHAARPARPLLADLGSAAEPQRRRPHQRGSRDQLARLDSLSPAPPGARARAAACAGGRRADGARCS